MQRNKREGLGPTNEVNTCIDRSVVSAACQSGDDRYKGNDVVDAVTFSAEVKRIEKLMYRVAWSYLGNNQDVEDAVQDAIVKAWEKRESLRRQEQFKP